MLLYSDNSMHNVKYQLQVLSSILCIPWVTRPSTEEWHGLPLSPDTPADACLAHSLCNNVLLITEWAETRLSPVCRSPPRAGTGAACWAAPHRQTSACVSSSCSSGRWGWSCMHKTSTARLAEQINCGAQNHTDSMLFKKGSWQHFSHVNLSACITNPWTIYVSQAN